MGIINTMPILARKRRSVFADSEYGFSGALDELQRILPVNHADHNIGNTEGDTASLYIADEIGSRS